MKKTIILSLISILLVIPTIFSNKVKAEDDGLPVIEKKTDRIFTIEGKDFDPSDCFVNPSDYKGRIFTFGESKELKKAGKHTIHFVIFNDKKVTFENVEVIVLSQKDYEDCINYINYDINDAYTANLALADLKGDGTKTKAYEIAQKYVGMPGTCLQVAYAFTREFQGERFQNFDNYKDVSVFEAAPGDIIYYENGGIGYEHWAVYLGGDLALQGNYIGGTVIGKVYLNNASDPQFRRLY